MKIRPLPARELLLERLDYNANTGIFIWKIRTTGLARPARWNQRYAGKPAGCETSNNYTMIKLDGQSYLAHRLAWLYHYGIDPAKMQVDHINRVFTDNRITNLRLADHSDNSINQKRILQWSGRPVKTVATGVSLSRSGKWVARLQKDKKDYWLGSFNTLGDALNARESAARVLHGPFIPI